jgi:uncharacterized protein YcbX/ferredoxin-NADP reductase
VTDITLLALSIYPLKSGKAIQLDACDVSEMGLAFDRRFVITDMQGQFVTGRTQPKISLIQVELTSKGVSFTAPNMRSISLKYSELSNDYSEVRVWDSYIQGQHCNTEINLWLCEYLAIACQLFYFGEKSSRQVKHFDKTVGFADGYPILLISQASLDELNRTAHRHIEMTQFRTNLVVTGCEPFAEDRWKRIKIGAAEFELVKPCERCVFTTLKPNSTEYDAECEPLKSLSLFRKDMAGGIDFGQNLISHNDANIQLGDKVEVLEYHQPRVYPDNRKNVYPDSRKIAPMPTIKMVPNVEPSLTNSKTDWGEDETRQLRCVAVIDETHDTKTFRFKVEPAARFDYKPGQFVTLRLKIGQELVTRNYTLSSSPSRPDLLAITVKRVPGGKASNWLNDHLTVGASLGASSPRGPFHAFTAPSKQLLLLSAGSGITPMLSMVRYYADTECDKDIIFFYSAQTAADLIAYDELKLLARQHNNMRLVLTLTKNEEQTSWAGYRGRIDQPMLADVVRDLAQRSAYVCGPEAFMFDMQAILAGQGLPTDNYFQESFGDHQHSAKPSKAVNVMLESWDTEFVGDNKTTLLDQAENNGVHIPYNCRAGFCGACRVTLVQGEVRELADHALTPADKQAKQILACSCVPQTDVIIGQV